EPKTVCAGLGLCRGPDELKQKVLRKVLNHAHHTAKMAHKYSYLARHVIDQDWMPVLSSAIKVISKQEHKVVM
ncbi:hypothetical protein ElyMa_005858200, partial [Elysia marginata]